MAITRTIWKNWFGSDNIPLWTCPSCKTGSLIGAKKNINVVEAVASQKARREEDWAPDWIHGSFGGTLKCNNEKCGESILIMGLMAVEQDVEYDAETGMGNLIHAEVLFPVAFIPTIQIFTIHSHVPGEIKGAVLESFRVYWIDIASCGNKIRIVVELIMDDQKISKTYVIAGKRKEYSLHKRIELFKLKKQEEAPLRHDPELHRIHYPAIPSRFEYFDKVL